MTQHRHFADWYESVSIHHDSKTLESRWKAVEQMKDSLTIPTAPGLVRTFFGLPGAESYCEEIRIAAKQHDNSYLIHNDRNELTVLSGGIIASAVDKSSTVADAVALGVSCADAQGMRKSARLQGVVDETSKYLAEESVRTRLVNIDANALDLDASALSKLLSTKGGVTISDHNTVWAATESIFKELIGLHSKQAESVARTFNLVIKREKEQSDILWWLVGEHTLDGTKSFSALSLPQACYWGAWDLNELTLFLPGPLGSPAFLHRMLQTVESKLPATVKVAECVDYCEQEWKKKWIEKISDSLLPDLCPMLFALAKSIEVGGAKAIWTPAFAHATGLSESPEAEPARLAFQVYNEYLLVRALAVKG